MATFLDMLNQGVGNLTGTPLGQLGMSLMAASGPMQGNPGGAARLGQALGNMGQMQFDQARLQQANQLRQIQQQELALRMQQMADQKTQRETLQKFAQANPGAFGSPMAAAMLGATGDAGMAAEMAKLGPQQPKVGAMPFESTVTNPDGTQQLQRYNTQTGQYEPVGGAFTPTAQQSLNLQGMKYQADLTNKDEDQARAERELQARLNQADVAAKSADARFMAEERKMQAAQLKNTIAQQSLESEYRGADAQINDTIKLATDLMKHPGLQGNFGLRGAVPNVPGSDAANARALMEQLQAQAGLTGLVRLEQQGVKLTPVSNTDLSTAQNSVINLQKSQDANSAKAQLQQYIDAANRAKEEAGRNFTRLNDLYKVETGSPNASAQPVRISDDAGFNALPSGATFIAPDGTTRRKP